MKWVRPGKKSSMETKRARCCLASGLKAKDTHLRKDGFGMKAVRTGGGSPPQAGGLSRSYQEREMKGKCLLLIVFHARREKKWGFCKRLQPSVIQACLSDTKTLRDGKRGEIGPTVGWLLARLMMRLSCTLLPHRGFPLCSLFLFFSFWRHRGGLSENWMHAKRAKERVFAHEIE